MIIPVKKQGEKLILDRSNIKSNSLLNLILKGCDAQVSSYSMVMLKNPQIVLSIEAYLKKIGDKKTEILDALNVTIIETIGGTNVYYFGSGNNDLGSDKDILAGFIQAISSLFYSELKYQFNEFSIKGKDSIEYYIYRNKDYILTAYFDDKLLEEYALTPLDISKKIQNLINILPDLAQVKALADGTMTDPEGNEKILMDQAKKSPEELEYAFRLHNADKKGPHLDLTIGLASANQIADFTIPNCKSLQDLLEINRKILAIPMIPHETNPYLTSPLGFTEKIEEGYGKGTWEIIAKGKAIWKKGHRSFTLKNKTFNLQFYHFDLNKWFLQPNQNK